MKVVDMDPSFARECDALADMLEARGEEMAREMRRELRKTGEEWKGQAQKRVPVDTGNLRQRILANVYDEAKRIVLEVGTNVKDYPIFLEFGTRHIAGGRVRDLGEDPGLTDAQAVKDWPAKRAEAIAGSYGGAAGGTQEQMPWLRPAFWAVAGRLKDRLDKLGKFPEQKR